jgi:hypothetical protein
LPHITPTLIFKIKTSTPFECNYQIVLTTFFVFVDAGEDLIMADDVAASSNLLFAPIKKKLEKIPLDMNAFQ